MTPTPFAPFAHFRATSLLLVRAFARPPYVFCTFCTFWSSPRTTAAPPQTDARTGAVVPAAVQEGAVTVTETPDVKETAAEFLTERRDFLHVDMVPGPVSGWDIVLRVDGTYSNETDARAVAEFVRARIVDLTDVRKDGWRAWHWPARLPRKSRTPEVHADLHRPEVIA